MNGMTEGPITTSHNGQWMEEITGGEAWSSSSARVTVKECREREIILWDHIVPGITKSRPLLPPQSHHSQAGHTQDHNHLLKELICALQEIGPPVFARALDEDSVRSWFKMEMLKNILNTIVSMKIREYVKDYCKRNGLLTLSVFAVVTGCVLGFVLRSLNLSTQVWKYGVSFMDGRRSPLLHSLSCSCSSDNQQYKKHQCKMSANSL